MKKEILENQALYSHLLNFDAVHRPFVPQTGSFSIDPAAGVAYKIPSPGMGLGNGPEEPKYAAKVLDDGSVLVTFYAPDAKTVEIAGIGGSMPGRYPLHKAEGGYWETILTEVGPGFHFCFYLVDGVMTFNPTMSFGFGASMVLNYFEVPVPDEDFYLLKDVPHGTIRMELMKSGICDGRYRNLWVYTPAGYDTSTKRYPVFHILHGGGENEAGWFWQGKLNYIADNLIASGQCEEMIIVASCFAAPKATEDGKIVNEDFSQVITREIVPFIDEKFRTIPDCHHRALAGLSAGGGQARQIVHCHPDVIANLGQFSSGAGFRVEGITTVEGGFYLNGDGKIVRNPNEDTIIELFKTPEHYNDIMDVTFVTCGTSDPRHKFTEPQVNEFREKGYNIEYACYPGYHEWDVWRYSARDFMKRLFK